MSVYKSTERINEAFKKSGLTQAELARRTGLGKSAISQYLNGKVNPKSDKIYLLAIALNVSPSWLMGISDEQSDNLKSVAEWVGSIVKTKNKDVLNIINKISQLDDNDLIFLDSVLDSLLSKKKKD